MYRKFTSFIFICGCVVALGSTGCSEDGEGDKDKGGPDLAADAGVPDSMAPDTRPPADLLLRETLKLTRNVGLILPPLVDQAEYLGLPPHEREELYLEGSHELTCLFFGDLARTEGMTQGRVE